MKKNCNKKERKHKGYINFKNREKNQKKNKKTKSTFLNQKQKPETQFLKQIK